MMRLCGKQSCLDRCYTKCCKPCVPAFTRLQRRIGSVRQAYISSEQVGSGIPKPRELDVPDVAEIVRITYKDLVSGLDLSELIERAYGLNGLGVCIVSGIPDLVRKRATLLPLAAAVAALPDDAKRRLEDAESSYSYGWSHGREAMSSGRLDTMKGSFYANPLHDSLEDATAARALTAAHMHAGAPDRGSAETLAVLQAAYPGLCGTNRWPRDALPELEPAFKDLGRLIVDVGGLIMGHCDEYVAQRLRQPSGRLMAVLGRSRNHKARLLHYFAQASPQVQAADASQEAWCGWHSDHGSLTGLTCAMYLDRARQPVENPDPLSGLYIKDRSGRVVKANIPSDCVAFQVGESLQVHSGGLLRATPHYVRAASGPAAVGISRNTFAVFMQPDVEERMDCPPGVTAEQVAIGQWRPGVTFGAFSEDTFKMYYGANYA